MAEDVHVEDFYKILEVSRHSTVGDIKKGYQRLVKQVYTDTDPPNKYRFLSRLISAWFL